MLEQTGGCEANGAGVCQIRSCRKSITGPYFLIYSFQGSHFPDLYDLYGIYDLQ